MSYLLKYFEENPSKEFTTKDLTDMFEKESSTIARNLRRLINLKQVEISKVGRANLKSFRLHSNYQTTKQDYQTTKQDYQTTKLPNKITKLPNKITKLPNKITIHEGKKGSGKTASLTQIQHLKIEIEGKQNLIDEHVRIQITMSDQIEKQMKTIEMMDITKSDLLKQLEILEGSKIVLEPKTKLIDFLNFTNMILSDAEKTGSNSCSIGEIKFRRSSIKNIYLLIDHYKKHLFRTED